MPITLLAVFISDVLASAVLTQHSSTQVKVTTDTNRQPVATSSQSPFKLVATVQQVMTTITIPASDVIFNAAAEIPKSDARGKACKTVHWRLRNQEIY